MTTYPKVAVRHALSAYFDVIDSPDAQRRTDLERLNAERMAAAWGYAKAVAVAKKRNRDFMQDWGNILSVSVWAPRDQPFQLSELDAWQMWLDAQRAVGGAA